MSVYEAMVIVTELQAWQIEAESCEQAWIMIEKGEGFISHVCGRDDKRERSFKIDSCAILDEDNAKHFMFMKKCCEDLSFESAERLSIPGHTDMGLVAGVDARIMDR